MLRNVDTLIIGGGLQACALGARLSYQGNDNFLIADPNPLLHSWVRGMSAQGLEVLRTPYTAHISPDDNPAQMWEHAHPRSNPPGDARLSRPASADHFNAHAKSVISRFKLEDRHVRAWMHRLEHDDGSGFLAHLYGEQSQELIQAEKVVVAVGLGRPIMPQGPLDKRVMHSDAFDILDLDEYGGDTCVVGGGLTAGTIAVRLAEKTDVGRIVLACRGPLTVSQLEADPAWIPGQQLAENFETMEWDEKARQLRAARVGRGVTPDIWKELTSYVDDGTIEIKEGVEVTHWSERGLQLYVPAVGASFDRIICATGYRQSVEDLPFLGPILARLDTTAGLPHVSSSFESTEISGLFFMGKLGELGGGPLTRNVPGARIAAARIAEALY